MRGIKAYSHADRQQVIDGAAAADSAQIWRESGGRGGVGVVCARRGCRIIPIWS